MKKTIEITFDKKIITESASVIIVPEMALQEAGYIKMFTVKDLAHSKHEYHAMAQMAYFQYQDDELEIGEIDSSATVTCGNDTVKVDGGIVIWRNENGEFHVVAHPQQNRKKLLEAAYRFCTRWVRLDI